MTRTLLITAGETPQVVTETVWALAQPPRAWKPDRILLATTASGAVLYRQGNQARGIAPLLGDGGRLAALAAHLWPGTPAPEAKLLVAQADGQPLPDLRTASEVAAFAEMLLAEVAAVTADPASALHVSLAGGRKTMSFLAGQVMSLLGRPQDALSHVLVEPAALEREPGFWWPGDGAPGSQTARVLLHEVPYLRARAWVEPDRLLAGTAEGMFGRVVERANQALGEADALLDLGACHLKVAGETVALSPAEAALLAFVFIARRRDASIDRKPFETEARASGHEPALDGDVEEARRLWVWLTSAADFERRSMNQPGGPLAWFAERCAERQGRRIDHDQGVRPHVSRVRKVLRTHLPTLLADRLLVPRPLTTLVPPDRIRIVAPAALKDTPDRPPEVDCGTVS